MPVELDYWARNLNQIYKQHQVEKSYTLKENIPKRNNSKSIRKFSIFNDD